MPFVFPDRADALLFSILILHFFIARDTCPTVARIAKISAFFEQNFRPSARKIFPLYASPRSAAMVLGPESDRTLMPDARD
jgi:hypothetical protein